MEPPELSDYRSEIDSLDYSILVLMARRELVVRQLTRLKSDEDEVRSPARVARVLDKIRGFAGELGLDEKLAVRAYEQIIDRLTEIQMGLFVSRINSKSEQSEESAT